MTHVPTSIPAPWKAVLRKISKRGRGTVLVIGETDRGKSTFCAFLSRELTRADFVIVSTTGFVSGPGATLQRYMIEALEPAWIVAIEDSRELHRILNACAPKRVIRIHPSPHAKVKSAEQRVADRERAFRMYFRSAKIRRLKISGLIFHGTRGTPAGAFQKGLLCALADSDGHCLGLALLVRANASAITILTPVTSRRIHAIQFGDLRVSRDGAHERLAK